VSPVRYELGSYIPKDGILHSHRLKSYLICVPQNYGVWELCPLAGILKTREHNVSVAGSFFDLRWRGRGKEGAKSLNHIAFIVRSTSQDYSQGFLLRTPLNSRRSSYLKSSSDLKNGVFWDVTPCDSCKN
jgi:hypothetical protein